MEENVVDEEMVIDLEGGNKEVLTVCVVADGDASQLPMPMPMPQAEAESIGVDAAKSESIETLPTRSSNTLADRKVNSSIRQAAATTTKSFQVEMVDDSVAAPKAAAAVGGGSMVMLVFLYSVCLLFSKWMNFLISLWLPVYLTEKAGYNEVAAGSCASGFDVGGVIGMGLAFYFNFRYKKPGTVCLLMCVASIPVLFTYNFFIASFSHAANYLILILVGILFNGPYSLISTVVTVQLSQQFGQSANTIISIVNGSGSAGSLFAGIFTGMVSTSYGWSAVFYMLNVLAASQIVPLVYVVVLEWRAAQSVQKHDVQARAREDEKTTEEVEVSVSEDGEDIDVEA